MFFDNLWVRLVGSLRQCQIASIELGSSWKVGFFLQVKVDVSCEGKDMKKDGSSSAWWIEQGL